MSSPNNTASNLPAQGAPGASTPGGKTLSAKELKRQARAARVAGRGPGADQVPASQASPSTPGGSRQPASAATGSSAAQQQQSGPSRHRRGIPAETTEKAAPAPPQNARSQFFSHLPVPRGPGTADALISDKIHPVIVRLGVLVASGTLRGASARTMAVLQAFSEVVHDYQCPADAVFWKDLNSYISPMIAYLETCRPKGVGVGNAIRWFKGEINCLGELHEASGASTELAQKQALMEAIRIYIRDRIVVAGQIVADNAKEKIKADDTVVVYARSSVVERALLEAFRDLQAQSPPASFNVVVIDSRPLHEGRALLSTLTAAGIPCTYTLLPLAATQIARSSLVLLGGSSLNSDGALHSRAGTAVVAMLAKEYRVPVVACLETFKLSERVALDDLAFNELGNAEDVSFGLKQAKASDSKNLESLALLYDLTPPSHITAVCTEVGFIPPSSVPTLLRKDVVA